jgi:adenylate cyclase
MSREVEGKYLVKNDSGRSQAGPGKFYRQGYLSTDPDRNVRVRIGDGKAVMTVKGKGEAARDEFEWPIPVKDAEQILSRIAIKPVIEKTRYEIRDRDLKWQIDEYEGENRGLVVAEVETDKDPLEVPKPQWLSEDVTDDPRYSNASLVKQPYRQTEKAGR